MSRGAEGIFAGSGLCQGMARRGGAGLRGRKPARSPGAQLVAVAVLAGWKAELGERRGEAEALRSCRKSFLGATVRCSRRFHLRSKARSRSSGY
jgi:hypothetical protein